MIRWTKIICLMLALAPGAALAEITFTASVDRNTISISDQLNLILTIEGARDIRPVLPETPDFREIRSSSSTHFSLINNETRVSQMISYTLMPLRTGEFTIPSARMIYRGKTYSTRPIKVRVVDGPAPPAAPPAAPPPIADPGPPAAPGPPPPRPEPDTAPALFIATEVDREEAYVNQQVTLTFKLYRRQQVANLQYTPPPTTGFVEESLGEEREFAEVVEGVRYQVLELRRAVFPISSGQLTIGPAELRGDILVPRRRTSPFGFDDFFGDDFFGGAFAERRPFALRSEPITLNVKSLPREGRPKNFRGAVGRFDLEVSASPDRVRAGEAVTVTMKVRGEGNLDNVTLPEIETGDAFQTYRPEVDTRRAVRDGRLGGEKIYSQVLIPLSPKVSEIPPASFSFFDPFREEYRTLTGPAIPITVEPDPEREALALVEDPRLRPDREGIRLLDRDILHIKTAPRGFRPRGRPYYRGTGFLGAVLGFPALLLVVWIFTARKERLRSDVVYARQVGASRSARRRFREARRLLEAGEGERFYGEVHRAFNRYLSDKFRIPAGAVSADQVGKILAAAAAPGEIAGEVGECLAAFDLVRFSGSAGRPDEMREFLSRVERLIGKLEKIKLR